MVRRKPSDPALERGLPAGDPRRPLKIGRLTTERARIAEFATRQPQLEDPDFEEWEQSVRLHLTELFGDSSYLLRFRQITFRDVTHSYYEGTSWNGNPAETWRSGLALADKILGQALEELEIELPVASAPTQEPRHGGHAPVVVNIRNVFSPEVHVTVANVLADLGELPLTPTELAAAREEVQALEEETKGPQRWPMIGRHIETLRSLGKGVYEKVAIPLLVEYLKAQMRAGGGPPTAL